MALPELDDEPELELEDEPELELLLADALPLEELDPLPEEDPPEDPPPSSPCCELSVLFAEHPKFAHAKVKAAAPRTHAFMEICSPCEGPRRPMR
jgi:hypothetical protein